jgi:hypothetical protein
MDNNFNQKMVGSCSDLNKRITEHLGRASDSTYALRFSEWLHLMSSKTKITCYYFKIDAEQNALQKLENEIWDILKPMFGKKGFK